MRQFYNSLVQININLRSQYTVLSVKFLFIFRLGVNRRRCSLNITTNTQKQWQRWKKSTLSRHLISAIWHTSQVMFIYIAIYTVQIDSNQIYSIISVLKFFNVRKQNIDFNNKAALQSFQWRTWNVKEGGAPSWTNGRCKVSHKGWETLRQTLFWHILFKILSFYLKYDGALKLTENICSTGLYWILKAVSLER